jgi:hypothetical protein
MVEENNVIDLNKKEELPKKKERAKGPGMGLTEIISVIAIVFSVIAFIGIVVLSVRGLQYGEKLSTVESLQDGMGKMVILNDIQTGLLNARVFVEENDFSRAGTEIERIQAILRENTLAETEEKTRLEALYRSLEELRAEISNGPSPLTRLFRESQKKAAALIGIP